MHRRRDVLGVEADQPADDLPGELSRVRRHQFDAAVSGEAVDERLGAPGGVRDQLGDPPGGQTAVERRAVTLMGRAVGGDDGGPLSVPLGQHLQSLWRGHDVGEQRPYGGELLGPPEDFAYIGVARDEPGVELGNEGQALGPARLRVERIGIALQLVEPGVIFARHAAPPGGSGSEGLSTVGTLVRRAIVPQRRRVGKSPSAAGRVRGMLPARRFGTARGMLVVQLAARTCDHASGPMSSR